MSTGLVVTLDGVDVTCHAWAPLEVSWGREHPGDSFEPRRATLTFDDLANPRRGQQLVATLQDPTGNATWATAVGTWAAQTGTWLSTRTTIVVFAGKITDTQTAWETVRVNGETIDRWGALIDVTALDPLSEIANLPVGDTPWPQESVSARAARIQALTPLSWASDPSGALVAARDADRQPAYDLLDDLAHWASLAGGLFYDPNAAVASFRLDALRNSTTPDLTIDACSIGADANAVVTIADVVNDVSVAYVAGSERATQGASIATYGRRARSISTELVDVSAARARASTEATRYGVAVERWESVNVGTRFGAVSAATAKTILAAGPSLRVRMTDLPAPATDTFDGYVEGWALTVDADDWQAGLNLSPAVWSGPVPTWGDLDPAQRWGDVVRPWSWADAIAGLPRTITNHGFETWLPSLNPLLPDGQPEGWGLFWITGTRQTVRKGPAHSGSFGLTWGPTGASFQKPIRQRLMSTSWPVLAGATVDVGIWAKARDSHHGTLQLDVFTAPHSNPQPFDAQTTLQTALALVTLTESWAYYSGSVVVPAGHAFAVFSPFLGAANILYQTDVDDAMAN